MKIKQEIEFLTAGDVLAKWEIEESNITDELQKLVAGKQFDALVFEKLKNYDLYYCSKHNIFHEYVYETDAGDIYTAESFRPVCPLCLLRIDITA